VCSCENRNAPSRATRMGSEDMDTAERKKSPPAITSSPFQGPTMWASRGAPPFPATPVTRLADERSALTHRSRLHSPCGMKGTRLREMDGKELLEVKISLHGDLCNWFGHPTLHTRPCIEQPRTYADQSRLFCRLFCRPFAAGDGAEASRQQPQLQMLHDGTA